MLGGGLFAYLDVTQRRELATDDRHNISRNRQQNPSENIPPNFNTYLEIPQPGLNTTQIYKSHEFPFLIPKANRYITPPEPTPIHPLQFRPSTPYLLTSPPSTNGVSNGFSAWGVNLAKCLLAPLPQSNNAECAVTLLSHTTTVPGSHFALH